MNIRRGFPILMLSVFCGLHPAWGGGWESSGSRMQDEPAQTTRAAESAHFECVTSIWREAGTGPLEEFSRTDELKPDAFKAGVALITTDALADGKTHQPFLKGQLIRLSVRDDLKGGGGNVDLSISLVSHARHGTVTSSTRVNQDRTRPEISASVTAVVEKTTYSLDVTCRDLEFGSTSSR